MLTEPRHRNRAVFLAMIDVVLIQMLNVTGGTETFSAGMVKYWFDALTH